MLGRDIQIRVALVVVVAVVGSGSSNNNNSSSNNSSSSSSNSSCSSHSSNSTFVLHDIVQRSVSINLIRNLRSFCDEYK
jgi:hypothetical protein